MTNKQIAERFANGYTSGKANSMFIDGNRIYSYGYHFPIAERTDKTGLNGKLIALFNSHSYSVTTSKHQGLVRFALSQAGYYVLEVSDLDNPSVESVQQEVLEALTKEKRARKEYSKEYWKSVANKRTTDSLLLGQFQQ